MSRPRAETLFGVMVARGGLRNAARALSYLGAWSITSRKVGHPATSEEFVADWLSSRTTEWRDRAAVTACLPDGWDVERLLEFVWGHRDLLSMARGMTGGRPSPSVLASLSQMAFPGAA